ncbi:MAG TPA: peroxiredoxin [Clostridia bacterium]|nr:peroxiredoxin [Clostridia bacterium]
MRNYRTLLTVVLFCLALPRFLAAQGELSAGSPAPEFTLKSQDGTEVSLRDYRGKWVVLYFYPNDFGNRCSIQARNFQRDQAQYRQKNAVVLGINLFDVESHKSFCDKEGLTFKLLADTDGAVSRRYGTLTNLLVTKTVSRMTFLIGPDGKVAAILSDVNAPTHSADVLAALTRLQQNGK